MSGYAFQSTLPVGGATGSGSGGFSRRRDFNPRSPWGERLARGRLERPSVGISIHAPRGGSDHFILVFDFQL